MIENNGYQQKDFKDVISVDDKSELQTDLIRPINTLNSTQNGSEQQIQTQVMNSSEVVFQLTDSHQKDIPLLEKQEQLQQQLLNDQIVYEPSLFKNKNLSPFLRYFMIFIMLLNIFLFISADTMTGGSIGVYFSIFSFTSKTVKLQELNMSQTTHDMWLAGLYPLCLLLLVTSCAWPFIKILMMFYCWICDSRYLKQQNRERLLIILDCLGKWSFIDTYVVAIMIVGFRFNLSKIIINNYQISLEVVVGIQWAYYSLVIGTSLSLMTTHFMIYYHRKCQSIARINREKKLELSMSQYELQQRQIEFQENSEKKYNLASQTVFQYYLVILLIVISSGLLIFGSFVQSYSFNFTGLAGFLLKPKGTNQLNESMMKMGIDIVSKSSSPDSFGIRTIQVLYYTIGIIIPIGFMGVLLILWTVPMKLSIQRNLFYLAEILNAWSCIDVFIVAIIASLVQMKQFAQYLIGDKCNELNKYLKLMDEFSLINLEGKDICFEVQTTLQYGCLILFSAALLYVISGTVVLRKCHYNLNQLQNKLKN